MSMERGAETCITWKLSVVEGSTRAAPSGCITKEVEQQAAGRKKEETNAMNAICWMMSLPSAIMSTSVSAPAFILKYFIFYVLHRRGTSIWCDKTSARCSSSNCSSGSTGAQCRVGSTACGGGESLATHMCVHHVSDVSIRPVGQVSS